MLHGSLELAKRLFLPVRAGYSSTGWLSSTNVKKLKSAPPADSPVGNTGGGSQARRHRRAALCAEAFACPFRIHSGYLIMLIGDPASEP